MLAYMLGAGTGHDFEASPPLPTHQVSGIISRAVLSLALLPGLTNGHSLALIGTIAET